MTLAAGQELPGDQRIATEPAAGRAWWLAAALTLLAAIVPAVMWPGDAPWIWDEPMEVNAAIQANQEHRLAPHGLSGSFPVPYGALGIHLYQFWLLFTNDPRKLVVLHALTCALPMAVALLWLARTLKLNPFFAAAVMAAPHIWFENRRLWQPSFGMPLGAMAVAAYAAFVARERLWMLLLAVFCCIAPLFIHLQSLPLSCAILGHIAWKQQPSLRRHALAVGLLLLAFLAVYGPYLWNTFNLVWSQFRWYVHTGHNSNTPLSQAWWGPMLAGRLFSGYDWRGRNASASVPLAWISSIAMPLVWVGVGVSLWHVLRGRPQNPQPSPEPDKARWQMMQVGIVAVVIHIGLCAVIRLASIHHYFFGTFGLYVLFAWIGLQSLPGRVVRGAVVAAYGLAGAMLTAGLIWHVHRDAWVDGTSPILDDQIAVAERLNHYSDTVAWTDVPTYSARPYVLWCLRRLYPPEPGVRREYSGHLFIRYIPGPDGKATHRMDLIEVDHQPPGADVVQLVPEGR